jgi:CBS domain containing-hemolysin-like protein
MEPTSALGLAAVAALLLANGFFVAAEFAIVAVRRSRLEQLAAEGHASARAALHVVARLNTYIAACQLGITMASLLLGWVGEPALAHLIEPPLETLIGRFAPAAAHGVAIAVALTLITSLHIIVGEQSPKGLALQRPEGTVLWIARPLQLFEVLFRWPTAVLNNLANGLLRLVGLEPTSGHEMVHSVEELRLLLTSSQRAGVVEASEARIASRAFSFADLTAGALMTPRTEVDAVPVDAGLSEVLRRAAASPHGRLPVYDRSLDNVVGVLHVRDLFKVVVDRLAVDRPAQVEVRRLLRPVMVVPESKPADDLLDDMRAARRHFAVVIDEYGGTAGIVTLRDLEEALVGPIEEEPATVDAPPAPPLVVSEPDGSMVVDGLMRLDECQEATGLRLEESDYEAAETLGGVVMARLGRIPELGDEVRIDGRILRVEQLDGMRVAQLRLLPPPAPSGESAA